MVSPFHKAVLPLRVISPFLTFLAFRIVASVTSDSTLNFERAASRRDGPVHSTSKRKLARRTSTEFPIFRSISLLKSMPSVRSYSSRAISASTFLRSLRLWPSALANRSPKFSKSAKGIRDMARIVFPSRLDLSPSSCVALSPAFARACPLQLHAATSSPSDYDLSPLPKTSWPPA